MISSSRGFGIMSVEQGSVLILGIGAICGNRVALIEAPHHRILGEKATRAHGGRGPIVDLLDQSS